MTKSVEKADPAHAWTILIAILAFAVLGLATVDAVDSQSVPATNADRTEKPISTKP